VIHKPFYEELKQNYTLFKQLIKKSLEALDILASLNIVHGDLKSENILISTKAEENTTKNQNSGNSLRSLNSEQSLHSENSETSIRMDKTKYSERNLDLKLIDFGSGFVLDRKMNVSISTPEYMSPELLQLLEEGIHSTQQISPFVNPWSFDVWSLGSIVLEICSGVPIWLSLKSRIHVNGRSIIGMGLFAVNGKSSQKIRAKQAQVVQNLHSYLKHYQCWMCKNPQYPLFLDLLSSLLHFNPKARISPAQALAHPFFE
jgi:serine/threonine protein kinase